MFCRKYCTEFGDWIYVGRVLVFKLETRLVRLLLLGLVSPFVSFLCFVLPNGQSIKQNGFQFFFNKQTGYIFPFPPFGAAGCMCFLEWFPPVSSSGKAAPKPEAGFSPQNLSIWVWCVDFFFSSWYPLLIGFKGKPKGKGGSTKQSTKKRRTHFKGMSKQKRQVPIWTAGYLPSHGSGRCNYFTFESTRLP